MAKKSSIHPVVTILSVAVALALLAYILFGWSRKRDIVGAWVADTSAVGSGFQCGTQGIAASVNNSTYQYNSWELSGNKMIMRGKLFQDRRVRDFCDTLLIKKLSSSVLVVEQDGRTTSYHKVR